MSATETIRIGIVEDQLMFREGLKAILRDFPSIKICLECENGRDFLDQVDDQIDIALMDIEMPLLNGIQTMEELSKAESPIKVILVSQNKDPILISKMMELGAKGYLTKDASSEELHKAILSVADTGYYFNDLVSKSLLLHLAKKDHVRPKFNYVETLSEREVEVLQLICKEYTTTEIAEKIFLSPKTVENHRSRIMDKAGVRNTAGLVVFALKHKLVDVD